MNLYYLWLVFLSGLIAVDGIMWHLEPNTRKCLREELQSDVLVTGEYEVSDVFGQKVDYTVSVIGAISKYLIYII